MLDWIHSPQSKEKEKKSNENFNDQAKSQSPIKIQTKELNSYLNGIKQAYKWTRIDGDEMQWKNKQGLMDVKCLN